MNTIEQELMKEQILQNLKYKLSILPPVIIPDWQKVFIPQIPVSMVRLYDTEQRFKIATKRKEIIYTNNSGSKFIILEYINTSEVIVEFINTGYRKLTKIGAITRGEVADPYERSFFNVGYMGIGPYNAIDNNMYSKCYSVWCSMIGRYYNINALLKNYGYNYSKIIVDPIWHCYQDFAVWFHSNYYELPSGETVCLDKDLLSGFLNTNNKYYGPNTCCFLPYNINCAIKTGSDIREQNYLPAGVSQKKDRQNKQYCAGMQIRGKHKFIGNFYTVEEAYEAYKIEKEKYIRSLAEEYKQYIPNWIYDILIQYNLENYL